MKYISLICILFVLGMAGIFFYLSDVRDAKLTAVSTPLKINNYQFSDSKNNNGLKVILFGDSRIEDWQFSWPDNINVLNTGIGGSTVFQSLARVEHDVLRFQPDWVVVQVGVNDAVASRMVLGESRENIINETANNLITLAETLVGANVNVIFMTIPPSINPDIVRYLFWQSDLEDTVKELNQYLKDQLPSNVVILDAYKLFQNKEGGWKSEFSRDALHWTREAYQKLSESVLNIIEEY